MFLDQEQVYPASLAHSIPLARACCCVCDGSEGNEKAMVCLWFVDVSCINMKAASPFHLERTWFTYIMLHRYFLGRKENAGGWKWNIAMLHNNTSYTSREWREHNVGLYHSNQACEKNVCKDLSCASSNLNDFKGWSIILDDGLETLDLWIKSLVLAATISHMFFVLASSSSPKWKSLPKH
jgi:hypothetical protein